MNYAEQQALSPETVIRKHGNLVDVLFSPLTGCFALVALTLSLFLPPDGLGITVCWFSWRFDLPCPGCGLTRSITSISHLQFENAWRYHPFGLLVYALFIANTMLLLLPKAMRRRLKNKISTHNSSLYPLYMLIVLSFLAFGGIRLLIRLSPNL